MFRCKLLPDKRVDDDEDPGSAHCLQDAECEGEADKKTVIVHEGQEPDQSTIKYAFITMQMQIQIYMLMLNPKYIRKTELYEI
jgi:hypothetical protein